METVVIRREKNKMCPLCTTRNTKTGLHNTRYQTRFIRGSYAIYIRIARNRVLGGVTITATEEWPSACAGLSPPPRPAPRPAFVVAVDFCCSGQALEGAWGNQLCKLPRGTIGGRSRIAGNAAAGRHRAFRRSSNRPGRVLGRSLGVCVANAAVLAGSGAGGAVCVACAVSLDGSGTARRRRCRPLPPDAPGGIGGRVLPATRTARVG